MLLRTSLLISLISALGLSACSVSTPFRGATAPEATGQTVFVGLTHAVLKDDRQSRSVFFDYVDEVEDSLPQNPGFLGFSKRVALFGNDAWTMSVWSDEQSLKSFVRSDAHRRAIRNASDSMTSARFARVEINAGDAPLDWKKALALLETEGWSY